MKKRLMLIAAVVLFVACGSGGEEPLPEPKPFPVGSWQTTHHYFSIVEDEMSHPELVGTREREESFDVGPAQAYQLTFNEDGTGNGSGAKPDGSGWYEFRFGWLLTDGRLTVTGSAESPVFYRNYLDMINSRIMEESVVWADESSPEEKIEWSVEQSSDEGMVLASSYAMLYSVSEIWIEVEETSTYRYTFEKVE